MLDYKELIPCCTGMIQREMAQRIAAQPGSKAYGILSVLIQAWYDVDYLFTVDENVFNPPPRVKSGVICMRRNGVAQVGLRRTAVQARGENGVQPATQDAAREPQAAIR